MSASSPTLEAVRRYHASWTTGDFASAIAMLAPALSVEVPVNRYPDKESFARALTGFGAMVQRTTLLGEFERGDEAVLLYDMEVGALGSLRVAEQFTVREGQISAIRQIHDTYAVRKAGLAPAGAKAVANAVEGSLLATVDLAAPADRVFRALASPEITTWWVRPGVFDTREWTGEVKVGGRWKATGVARGKPYEIIGEFTIVDRPRTLAHTWVAAAARRS